MMAPFTPVTAASPLPDRPGRATLRLERALLETLGESGIPQDCLPQAELLPVWDTPDLAAASIDNRALPFWGGTW